MFRASVPLDDDAYDPDAEEIAYHEAGQATALVLFVEGWTETQSSRDPDPGMEFFNGLDNDGLTSRPTFHG